MAVSPSGVRYAVRRSLALLEKRDRVKFGAAVGIQMFLSMLDLLGVLLVGLVATIAVSAIGSESGIPGYAQTAIDWLGLEDWPLLNVALALALVAAAFLVLKSVTAVVLIRRVLRFLAGRQAQVASRLTGELFARPVTFLHKRTSQEVAFALMEGTTAATVSLLGSLSLALSDVALLSVLTVTLLIIDPLVTLAAIGFFVVIALVLQRILGSLARRSGTLLKDMSVAGLSAVQEGLSAYREITVANKRSLYRDRISQTMWRAAGAQADVQYVAQVPKYVFETALVVGALALVIAQSGTGDPASAVGSMALFLAAGARVMPSLLRLQVSLISIRQAETRAQPTYDLEDELGARPLSTDDFDLPRYLAGIDDGHADFVPSILVRGVTYRYPEAVEAAVEDVTFDLLPGRSIALVGSTGAGKSTLADLVLGVLRPDSGSIEICGLPPGEAATRWPGAIAYVPQAVALASGTVRENVALGLPLDDISDDLVWEALDRAHLGAFLREIREGLDTVIGERGVRLSGGQRQRLGIARALYSRPKLLVLDEATSALDAETEASITAMLAEMAGQVTTVTVAHRLATVRSAHELLYLEDGRVLARGTFDEVRASHPAFDRQARLLGL
ncbi:MAG: ATP-binding cassette domain-containing protein [Actinomycetales bacterium]|nr:ATP-binding cassette domain-containing protein [Actinomycetales bacterium]